MRQAARPASRVSPDSTPRAAPAGGRAPARDRSRASACRSAVPSSCTAVTSASISIGRPSSRSCSIEVLCAPTSSAPAMRLSTSIGNFTPSAVAIVSASTIMVRATARVPGSPAISSSVPPVSAEIGLKREVAPELHPDVVADVGADRRADAGGTSSARKRRARARSFRPTARRAAAGRPRRGG